MNCIYSVLIQSVEITTLICGISGIVLSLLLIFSLDATKNVSELFNRMVDMDKALKPLDTHIDTEGIFYRHHFIFGLFFVLGSFFSLVFLFKTLDITAFIKILNISGSFSLLIEVVLNSMALFGKITAVLGILCGFLLAFTPDIFRRFEAKASYWIMTHAMEEKLNEMHKDTDTICFLHSTVIGLVVLITSLFLTILSVFNLFK